MYLGVLGYRSGGERYSIEVAYIQQAYGHGVASIVRNECDEVQQAIVLRDE